MPIIPYVATVTIHNWLCGDMPIKNGLPLSALPALHKTWYIHGLLKDQCQKFHQAIIVVIDNHSKLGSSTRTAEESNWEIKNTLLLWN